MEVMNIRIGPLTFDHADYDADGDVLYLHVGQPQAGEGEETPEGHVLRFAPGTQQIIGLTVINARQVLNRDGRLIVRFPRPSRPAPTTSPRRSKPPDTTAGTCSPRKPRRSALAPRYL
jgi:uncharacterized protein YuzE